MFYFLMFARNACELKYKMRSVKTLISFKGKSMCCINCSFKLYSLYFACFVSVPKHFLFYQTASRKKVQCYELFPSTFTFGLYLYFDMVILFLGYCVYVCIIYIVFIDFALL